LILSGVESDGRRNCVVGRVCAAKRSLIFRLQVANNWTEMNFGDFEFLPRREALLVTADGGPYEFEYNY